MAGLEPRSHNAIKFPIVSYQPLRFVYWLGRKAWLLIRVPFWVAYLTIFPRPHPKWALSTTLISWLGKEEGEIFASIGITEELSLEPGNDDFEVIHPASAGLYMGPLEHPAVQPEPIGMTRYWYQPPTAAAQASADCTATSQAPPLVILHLHGGAFVWGSGRPKQLAFLAGTLLTEARGAVHALYAPQYRLSGYGAHNNPFPAALQDALTAYLHLVVTLGIPPGRIVIAGDSAGGNLAIALIRYIEAFGGAGPGPGIPRPFAAVLVSPWIAPSLSLGPLAQARATFTRNPHWATDYMPFGICRWGARAYTALVPAGDPYITALGHPFRTQVPVLVALGGAEVLEAEGTQWAGEMAGVPGNRVQVLYEEAAPHDTLLLGAETGWAESARGVAGRIAGWLTEVRGAAGAH